MQRIVTDTRTWKAKPLVAQASVTHMIQVGIFPERPVRDLWRVASNGTHAARDAPAGSSTYRDTSSHRAAPIATPRETGARAFSVIAPRARTAVDQSRASGKGMWLYWSLNPLGDGYCGSIRTRWSRKPLERAPYVEIRTRLRCYVADPPEAKPTIDAHRRFGGARHRRWAGRFARSDLRRRRDVRPRRRYRTPRGRRLLGVAVDFERGDDFMGGDPNGLAALWQYEQYLREAVGSKYLIVATVEDPSFEHLDESKYPFREIARYADVLQPMAYWRMMRRTPTTPDLVKSLMAKSVTTLLALSGRTLPVSIGGQTTAEGRNGYPPAAEITASLDGAKAAGAVGVCYVDCKGTQPYEWDALANYHW